MIVPMAKVRVLGPGARLSEVLRVVQDVGVMHLTPPPLRPHLETLPASEAAGRRRRQLERSQADCDAASP